MRCSLTEIPLRFIAAGELDRSTINNYESKNEMFQLWGRDGKPQYDLG